MRSDTRTKRRQATTDIGSFKAKSVTLKQPSERLSRTMAPPKYGSTDRNSELEGKIQDMNGQLKAATEMVADMRQKISSKEAEVKFMKEEAKANEGRKADGASDEGSEINRSHITGLQEEKSRLEADLEA